MARTPKPPRALDPQDDRVLERALRAGGVSRAELISEQYMRHPEPRSAGVLKSLAKRGNECELFGRDAAQGPR